MISPDWLALAVRAKAIKSPDRVLDADIWAAIQGVEIVSFKPRSNGGEVAWNGDLKFPNWPIPPEFSQSFDAAIIALDATFYDAFYVYARGRLRESEPLWAFDIRFGSDEIIAEAESDWGPGAVLAAICKAMAVHEDRPSPRFVRAN